MARAKTRISLRVLACAKTVSAQEFTTAKSALSPHFTTSRPSARAESAIASDSYAFTLHPSVHIEIFLDIAPP